MWHLAGIADSLKRIADCLERVVIRTGPFKDHVMTVARNADLEDAVLSTPTASGRGDGVPPQVQVVVQLPDALPPIAGDFNAYELTTVYRDNSLPKLVEYPRSEPEAVALFNQKKKLKGVQVTLDRVMRTRVSEYFN